MSKTIRTTLLALAALAAATTAQAQTYEQAIVELERAFARSDTNNDSKLTKQEAKAGGMSRIAQNFGRIDTDKDGFVTLAQLKVLVANRYKK